jgi:hypothetical protein
MVFEILNVAFIHHLETRRFSRCEECLATKDEVIRLENSLGTFKSFIEFHDDRMERATSPATMPDVEGRPIV